MAASMDYVQHNAIFEAVHMASVPQDTELRLGELTSPQHVVRVLRRFAGKDGR